MIPRRTVLTALGLVPATAAIPCTEDLAEDTAKGLTKLPMYSEARNARVATALERLADGIRKKEIGAIEFEIRSQEKPDKEFLTHELTIRFELVGV